MQPSDEILCLRVENIFHSFQNRDETLPVLRDISLEVSPGETASLLGPSGCGKSTLLRCIAGLLKPSSGRISVAGLSPCEAARQKRIGFAFQEPALLSWLKVDDNIRLPVEIGQRDVIGEEAEQRLEEMLRLTSLMEFRHYYPDQLSGGMKQRVALARALYTRPGVFLLDEPFAPLDLLSRTALAIDLRRIVDQAGVPALLVTHSVEEAVIFSQRIYILSSRPAKVRRVIEVPSLPAGMDILDDEKFLHVAGTCRRTLLEENPAE